METPWWFRVQDETSKKNAFDLLAATLTRKIEQVPGGKLGGSIKGNPGLLMRHKLQWCMWVLCNYMICNYCFYMFTILFFYI